MSSPPVMVVCFWWMVPMMEPIRDRSSLARPVVVWIAAIFAATSSVARDIWQASSLTSEATTAKPSPALAASMVALRREDSSARRSR